MFVLPRITRPAARSRVTIVASYGGRQPSRIFDPQVVGTPLVVNTSLTATGTPASGPGLSPAARRASTAAAAASAPSESTCRNACTRSSTAAIRSRCARVTSTDETSRAAISAASSAAGLRIRSVTLPPRGSAVPGTARPARPARRTAPLAGSGTAPRRRRAARWSAVPSATSAGCPRRPPRRPGRPPAGSRRAGRRTCPALRRSPLGGTIARGGRPPRGRWRPSNAPYVWFLGWFRAASHARGDSRKCICRLRRHCHRTGRNLPLSIPNVIPRLTATGTRRRSRRSRRSATRPEVPPREPGQQFLGRHRAPVVPALRRMAAAGREQPERRLVLHALGDHAQPERTGQLDERPDDRLVVRVADHAEDERPVDLYLGQRQP